MCFNLASIPFSMWVSSCPTSWTSEQCRQLCRAKSKLAPAKIYWSIAKV